MDIEVVMSAEVIIYNEKPMSIMGIVQELRDHGYKQKIDFDFQYVPASTGSTFDLIPRHTIFTFHNELIASWFAMKYV